LRSHNVLNKDLSEILYDAEANRFVAIVGDRVKLLELDLNKLRQRLNDWFLGPDVLCLDECEWVE